jgi:hypothetical protein
MTCRPLARLGGAGGAPRAGTVDDLGQMDSNGMLLMNVNTPDDHRQAERRLRTRS